jgi:hypothetical protein
MDLQFTDALCGILQCLKEPFLCQVFPIRLDNILQKSSTIIQPAGHGVLRGRNVFPSAALDDQRRIDVRSDGPTTLLVLSPLHLLLAGGVHHKQICVGYWRKEGWTRANKKKTSTHTHENNTRWANTLRTNTHLRYELS